MYKNTDETFLLTLHELLSENPRATQRDIAARMEISLGLANQILSRVTGRGWVNVERVNQRNMRYVVTEAGREEIARLNDERKRTLFGELRLYGENIAERIGRAKERGLQKVVLYGESDLDFLIAYECQRQGMSFERRGAGELCADGGTGIADRGGVMDEHHVADGHDAADGVDAMAADDLGAAAGNELAIAGERTAAENVSADAVSVMRMVG